MVTGIPAVRLPRLRRYRLARIVTAASGLAATLRDASDAALHEGTAQLRRLLRTAGMRDALVARAFALIRELAERRSGCGITACS